MIENISQFLIGLCVLLFATHAQEINNEVEIISGKEMPAPNNVIGVNANGYYGPHVGLVDP